MFGRTMSIPDKLILTYFTYFTDVSEADLAGVKGALERGENPMALKKRLGREIAMAYGYSAAEAQQAEEKWVAQFSRGEVPEDIPDVVVKAAELPMQAAKLLVTTGLAPSAGEARRLIEQGGFTVDGEKVSDPRAELVVTAGQVLKAGKRKYGRVVIG
jgi:tyrosyl-tRNA synthetase